MTVVSWGHVEGQLVRRVNAIMSCTMLPLSGILQAFSSDAILDARNISMQPGRIWVMGMGIQLNSGWGTKL